MAPQVSVIVRSYNRVGALLELLPALLAQRHDSFEIVVVEQSTKVDPADAARLAELERDDRLRVLRHPPLGGARARNTGVAAARGELLAFIDDDDLPVGDDWLANLILSYDDPLCVGVSGRQVHQVGEGKVYVWPDWWVRRRCMRFSPLLKLPLVYVRHDLPTRPVDYVHGTNGSLRRSAVERFGGWDEDARIEDEASFGLRAAKQKRPGEYFCFDPRAIVKRGLDVQGGLDKRFMTKGQFYERYFAFVHRIIGRYHRARLLALFPLYLAAVYLVTVDWIWSDSRAHASTARRLGATLALVPAVPWHAFRALRRR